MATVSLRMDDALKSQTESILKELGLNMTTAFTMFAKQIVREKRLPLNLDLDPFYSEKNMARLEASIADKRPPIVKTMAELEAMANE